MPSSASTQPVLSVRHLRTYYDTDEGLVRAVDDISFDVPATGSVGIAGESGSGKTQTALSILGLIDGVPGIVGGEIRINEKNLLAGLDTFCSVREKEGFITITKDVSRWRAFYRKRRAHLRGEKIAMIFQEPKSALIPYYTVGEHMRETMMKHLGKETARTYREYALILLQQLQFDQPRRILESYPNELSGGECQRIMLGLALLGRPDVLIADEPTTLLDTVTQHRVLEMLDTIVHERALSLLLITHDLALLRLMVTHVAVMFAGKIVEWGPVASVIAAPSEKNHPYTRDLMHAASKAEETIVALPCPTPLVLNTTVNHRGCRYYHRCSLKDVLPEPTRKRCLNEVPPAFPVGTNHTVACWGREQG